MPIAAEALLRVLVVRPVAQVAAANDISLGKSDAPYCSRSGNDQIASLAVSFNRMRLSPDTALKTLGESA